MNNLTRDQIRKLFPKVKKIQFPSNFDEIQWDKYYFYLWFDEGNENSYFVTDLRGKLEGILFSTTKVPKGKLVICDITRTHAHSEDTGLIVARMRSDKSKTFGYYVCLDIDWIHEVFREKRVTELEQMGVLAQILEKGLASD